MREEYRSRCLGLNEVWNNEKIDRVEEDNCCGNFTVTVSKIDTKKQRIHVVKENIYEDKF